MDSKKIAIKPSTKIEQHAANNPQQVVNQVATSETNADHTARAVPPTAFETVAIDAPVANLAMSQKASDGASLDIAQTTPVPKQTQQMASEHVAFAREGFGHKLVKVDTGALQHSPEFKSEDPHPLMWEDADLLDPFSTQPSVKIFVYNNEGSISFAINSPTVVIAPDLPDIINSPLLETTAPSIEPLDTQTTAPENHLLTNTPSVSTISLSDVLESPHLVTEPSFVTTQNAVRSESPVITTAQTSEAAPVQAPMPSLPALAELQPSMAHESVL